MKKVSLIVLTSLCLMLLFIRAEKAAVLKELMKPGGIAVDKEQFYVTEGTTVFIYSRDYTFKKKFGKKGEGPREFMAYAAVTPMKDCLLIGSQGKISYYTKDGVFIKELKASTGTGGDMFMPLKDNFAGRGYARADKVGYFTVNLFDGELKKIKELYRTKATLPQVGKIDIMKGTFGFKTLDGKVFIPSLETFAVEILDHTGKPIARIERKD